MEKGVIFLTDAETMKKLRDKRRENNLCTRCGKWIEEEQYKICSECREYLRFYKKYDIPPARKETLINRSPVNEIKNKKLYQLMIDYRLSTKNLANKISVTQRSVQRWIFDGLEPKDSNKKEVNEFFGEEIFKIKED